MLQRSPILRFALEVLQHALESYCSEKARDKKIAILHLAQSVELSVKAALVEKNISIYDRQGNRTITPHDALGHLAKAWGVERIVGQSRVELLIDERNAIQHRYGSIDDVTLDYHMQTAFDMLSTILKTEFDTELADWIKDNLERPVWERVRFVAGEEESSQTPSDAITTDRSPVLDFVEGFSRYESRVREKLSKILGKPTFTGSTLDVMLKALSNSENVKNELIRQLPNAYRLRNRVVHGDAQASLEDVKPVLLALDEALGALDSVPQAVLTRAVRASERGDRGTTLAEDEPPEAQEQ